MVCLAARGRSVSGEAAVVKEPLLLENRFCRLEVDPTHGRLLRLTDRVANIDLAPPPELAENFRLLVPLPDDPHNFIHGREQRVSKTEWSESGLELHWGSPLRDSRHREHDLAVRMSIELQGRAVVFRFSLENRMEHTVWEVWYPCIGGLLQFGPPESRAGVSAESPSSQPQEAPEPLRQPHHNLPRTEHGLCRYRQSGHRSGDVLCVHDPVARFKAFHFREVQSSSGADVLGHLIHFAFVQSGEAFEGSPLVVQFHEGDWVDSGKKIYRPWFEKAFGLMTPEQDWIRQQGFFQMIMIMLPEGNVNYTIREIPRLARDGLDYGVTSLQIAGWQRGGHDNGYPYYEPDPRLGTWEDLEEAIRKCHELGVKVYFFVNIHVNNLDTEWYKRELKDYNYETLKGFPYAISGWGMGTLASRMALTTPLMAVADTSFPAIQDGLLAYFRKLAEMGADGIHIDKFFPRPLNFNPRVPLSPDQSPWEGTIRLVDRISRECRALNPDFRISFETNWDRVLQYGNATWWAGNMSTAQDLSRAGRDGGTLPALRLCRHQRRGSQRARRDGCPAPFQPDNELRDLARALGLYPRGQEDSR